MALATTYTKTAANLHWIVAGTMSACIGTVLKAQDSPKQDKGYWMQLHKSFGLLTGVIVLPRVGYRLLNASKFRLAPIEGTTSIERVAGGISHLALYGFMTVMPVTGIMMGYFGGKGLPFFGTTIPGITHTVETKKSNQSIAGQSFKVHKTIGTYGKFLVPIHAGAAVQHSLRGHSIFSRISPFRSTPR